MPEIPDFAFTPTTGLRDSTAFPTYPATEADARDQVQDISDQLKDYLNGAHKTALTEGYFNYGASSAGSDTYAVTITNFATYAAGTEVFLKADVANTGAATININSLGAVAIRKNGTTVLEDGDIPAGGIAHLKHDGTNFQLLNVHAIAKSIFTAQGDTLYASAAGTPARLAKGTALQVLQMNSGATAPEWAASPQSVLTTQGDLLYASAANTLARLAKGTAYQQLRMNSSTTAPEWFTIPVVRAYHSGSQTVNSATETTLSFDSETYDTDTMHDNATNNSRLTCNTAGKYRITAELTYASGTTGTRAILIKVNGGTTIGYLKQNAPSSGDLGIIATTSPYPLGVSDYVIVQAYHTEGSALNVTSAVFSMEWVAP